MLVSRNDNRARSLPPIVSRCVANATFDLNGWSAHHESTDDAYLEGHLHPISAGITDTVQQVLIDDNLPWTAAIFIPAFVIIELRQKELLVDVRLFARRNFGLGSIVNVVLGIGLYGVVFILPLYLGQMHGYDASQIARVLIWLGLPQLLVIPLVPKLMELVDTRLIIGAGVLLFGGSSFLTADLGSDFAGPQFYLPLILRALGQPLIMVPLSAVTTAGMAKGRESGSASALFNMMRNIGGSIGIAGLSTLLSVRERFHSERIGESVTSIRAPFKSGCENLRHSSSPRAAIRTQPKCVQWPRLVASFAVMHSFLLIAIVSWCWAASYWQAQLPCSL